MPTVYKDIYMQEYDDVVGDHARSYYVGVNYADIAQNTNLFLNSRYMQPLSCFGFWVTPTDVNWPSPNRSFNSTSLISPGIQIMKLMNC